MAHLGWALWIVSSLAGFAALYYGLKLPGYTKEPTWWIMGPWNLLGLSLILFLHVTPWHLLWWWWIGLMIGGVAKFKMRRSETLPDMGKTPRL